MTADQMTQACPGRDSARLSRDPEREPSREWFCTDCRSYFGEPVTRIEKTGFRPGSLAEQLLEAEPDDVGRSA